MLGSNRGGTLSVGTWRAQPARCNMAHIPAGRLWGLQLWAQHATMEAGVAWRGSGLWQPCIIMLNSLHPLHPTVKCDSVLSMDSSELREVHPSLASLTQQCVFKTLKVLYSQPFVMSHREWIHLSWVSWQQPQPGACSSGRKLQPNHHL